MQWVSAAFAQFISCDSGAEQLIVKWSIIWTWNAYKWSGPVFRSIHQSSYGAISMQYWGAMILPKSGLPYSADENASDYQVGYVLFKTYPDDCRKSMGYCSRSIPIAEKNYSVTKKDCLAVVYGFLFLSPYFIMEGFAVRTDHVSLRLVMKNNDPSGRLMRWRLQLSEYDIDV